MNTTDENRQKVEEFIDAAEGQWIDIKAGNSKAGNAKVKVANKIVANWAKKGLVEEFLTPLLKHESSRIRLAAAAHLINHGCKEQAIAELRNLVKEPDLTSSMAQAVLRVNKITIES